MQPAPHAPQTFGTYRTVSVLGQGGMGIVYAAVNESTGAQVAIKAFGSSQAASDPMELSRFDREARILCTIDSDHVAKVLDMGRRAEDGAPFLVMELLVGETLKQAIQRYGKVTPELAVAVATQACRGLVRAHQKGVVHRDVKPANLFLAQTSPGVRTVKILDFGIAKFMGTAAQLGDGTLTQTGTLVGSPLYMSPEQAMGLKQIDARSDVWSMGMVLYEAMTGSLPFAHVETVGQLIVTICGTPVPPVQGAAPWVPAQVAAVVEKALRIKPEERFQDARAMLDALVATGADLAITDQGLQRSAELGETVRMPSRALGPPDASGHGLAATVHGGPTRTAIGLAAAGGVVLATLLAVVTFLLMRPPQATPTTASPSLSTSAIPTTATADATTAAATATTTAVPPQATTAAATAPPTGSAPATPTSPAPTTSNKRRPPPPPPPPIPTQKPVVPSGGGRETM